MERAELVPFRSDHQRVGSGGGFVGVVAELHILQMRLCILHRLGVVGTHERSSLLQSVDERDRRRIAHVVGLGLERQPENRDGLAIQLTAERGGDFVDHALLDRLVHAQHCFDELELVAVLLGDISERGGVFREARAAEAGAGLQEFGPDTAVEADAACDILHVSADELAELGHFVDERDLRRQKPVRGVLDHLRYLDVRDDERDFERVQRRVDLLHQVDRFVIRVRDADDESIDLMKEIYAPLHSLEIPFVITNVEISEMIKYAANGFLATKISFINEVAQLCELVGADVQDVARGIGLDGRIGPTFLQAGPGFGGSCFPKDTSALADIAQQHGYEFELIEAVLRVNQAIKERMVDKVAAALGGELNGKTIAILGLAFKPQTDDMRDSPTITLINGLQKRGALVRAYDPQAMKNAEAHLKDVEFCNDAYETAAGADALVIATEWNEFRALDLELVKNQLRHPIIVDLRNVYEPKRMKSEGFHYYSVGRANVSPESV